jgi:glycosyltransferase involved in cell wall biosynthesis
MMNAITADPRVVVDLAGKFDSPAAARDARESVRQASATALKNVIEVRVRRLLGPLTWERGVVTLSVARKYDVVVLEGRIYTLSTWVALILRRVTRRRTLLWGHGWRRADRGWRARVRLTFYRSADGLLVYGSRARKIGADLGYPIDKIHIVGNSIYASDEMPEPKSSPLIGPNGPIRIISVGRLSFRRELQLLVHAAADLREAGVDVEVTIVGDGEAREDLAELIARRQAPVSLVGAIYEKSRLDDLYRASEVAVIPGAAGLGIIQSLALGCPVVIHDDDSKHGPESEAVVAGVNGGRFERGSITSLCEAIRTVSSWRRANPVDVSHVCWRSVVNEYSAETHAAAIAKAIADSAVGQVAGLP